MEGQSRKRKSSNLTLYLSKIRKKKRRTQVYCAESDVDNLQTHETATIPENETTVTPANMKCVPKNEKSHKFKKKIQAKKSLHSKFGGFTHVEKCENDLIQCVPKLIHMLNQGNILNEFMLLVKQISSGGIKLDNIALLLCLETAKLKSLKTTSSMRYSPNTLKFWKVVYRLLGIKF